MKSKVNMPQLTISTAVEIHSSAQRIWDLILDFDNYPRWNPSVRRARGRAEPGQPIDIWVTLLPLLPPVHVRALLLEVEPPR